MRRLFRLVALVSVLALAAVVTPPRAGVDHVAAAPLPVVARHAHLSPQDKAPVALIDQARGPRDCGQFQSMVGNLRSPGITPVVSSADLGVEGEIQLCVYEHAEMQALSAWLPAARSVAEFRAQKADLAPRLAAAGVDPCRIAFWVAVDGPTNNATSPNDEHDAGRRCEPELILHDAKAEGRGDELRRGLAASIAKGEEVFGRPNTWPLRIHAWGDNVSFIIGSVNLGVPPGGLAFEAGVAMVSNLDMPLIVMDLTDFPRADDATVLIAHEYAHILQHSVMGCSCTLPFFAVEGGAEFFASLVAGPAQPHLARRFQVAKDDSLQGKIMPLTRLVDRVDSAAPYTRGYAAMHFLDSRWGAGTYARLYLDNVDGSPQRYLDALAALTGMDLEGFDRALTDHLRAQRGFAPPPGPATTLSADSRLLRLFTARARDADEEASRFGAGDRAVFILAEWDCLTPDTARETVLFEPGGRRYATARSNRGEGCRNRTYMEFELDNGGSGPAPRTLAGEWKVEVYANGTLQGTVRFTVGP